MKNRSTIQTLTFVQTNPDHLYMKLNMPDTFHGRIPDFKLGGAHLKKLRRAEGGTNIFGVFHVKNHDFTPKNHIFFQFKGGGGAPPPGSAPQFRFEKIGSL